jgi:hypothetical protein
MKYYKYIFWFTLSFYSCNVEKGNSIDLDQERAKLICGRNYYWEKSDENRFLVVSFDSTDNIYCTMYSFGNEDEQNEKIYFVKSREINDYELISLDSNKIEYEVKVSIDKSLILSTLEQKPSRYKMIIDDKFQELFGRVKSKFQFKCISSEEIVYNKIIAYKTTVKQALLNPTYKRKIESYDDEIYGKGENYYFDFNGNKFYYVNEPGRDYFYKMEIINNKMDFLYLDIKIGDKRSEIYKKLDMVSKPYQVTNSEIVISICNAMFEGGFGYLKFKFIDLGSNDPILENIDYNAYYDGE